MARLLANKENFGGVCSFENNLIEDSNWNMLIKDSKLVNSFISHNMGFV